MVGPTHCNMLLWVMCKILEIICCYWSFVWSLELAITLYHVMVEVDANKHPRCAVTVNILLWVTVLTCGNLPGLH